MALSGTGQYKYVVFTLNNPGEEPIPFNEEKMSYLVYQREVAPETGTEHYQGYCELKARMRFNPLKALLGGDRVHIERRRGSAQQAADYCKKEESRKEGCTTQEFGTISFSQQGKRNDLEEFKNEVLSGTKRKRDLIDDHAGTFARYPKFYDTLTSINRPTREEDLQVILHIGETGLGKTRRVFDTCGESPELYVAPLSNGTTWFDAYDRHKTVLLDDFAGASSHTTLVSLLRLLDRYPVLVPTKGGHTWWCPSTIYITTNILPKDWYKWENRGEQYKALARRITKVILFYPPLHDDDPGFVEQDNDWWKENAPSEAIMLYSQ